MDEDPARLRSIRSQRIRHELACMHFLTQVSVCVCMCTYVPNLYGQRST